MDSDDTSAQGENIKVTFVILSDKSRNNLQKAARKNASRIGLSPDEWQERRRKRPVVADTLMAIDPR